MARRTETVTAFLSNGGCVSVAKRNGLSALLLRAGALGGGASIVRIVLGENAVMRVDEGEAHTEWVESCFWSRPKGAPDFPLSHFKNADEAREWFAQMIETCDPSSAESILLSLGIRNKI